MKNLWDNSRETNFDIAAGVDYLTIALSWCVQNLLKHHEYWLVTDSVPQYDRMIKGLFLETENSLTYMQGVIFSILKYKQL